MGPLYVQNPDGTYRTVDERYGSFPPDPRLGGVQPDTRLPGNSPWLSPLGIPPVAPTFPGNEIPEGSPWLSPLGIPPDQFGGLPQETGQAPSYGDYTQAPAAKMAGAVDPGTQAISPSFFGSSMFPTAEMEMEYADAVRSGDPERIRTMLRKADEYSKQKARSEQFDRMVNMAVMTGLGIAAGAPGSYGDFGTQVARGALTGINYANQLNQQDSLDEYRKEQLKTARARAMSYANQVAISKQNADLKEERSPSIGITLEDGTQALAMPGPNGVMIPKHNPDGSIARPKSTVKFGDSAEGVWRYDSVTNTFRQVPSFSGNGALAPFVPIPPERYGEAGGIVVGGQFRPNTDERGNWVANAPPDKQPLPVPDALRQFDVESIKLPEWTSPEIKNVLAAYRNDIQTSQRPYTRAEIENRVKTVLDMHNRWVTDTLAGSMAQMQASQSQMSSGSPPVPAPPSVMQRVGQALGMGAPSASPGAAPLPSPAALATPPPPPPPPTMNREEAMMTSRVRELESSGVTSGQQIINTLVSEYGISVERAKQIVRGMVNQGRPPR